VKVLKNPGKSPRSNPSFHDPARRFGDHVWSDRRSYSCALIPRQWLARHEVKSAAQTSLEMLSVVPRLTLAVDTLENSAVPRVG